MEKKELKLLPLDLQFFAEGSDEGADGDVDNKGNDGSDAKDQASTNNPGDKTFTQAQVSAMMAKEKNEGKRAALKALGFSSEADAKKAIESYNAIMNLQKSDEDKLSDEVKKAQQESNDNLSRAIEAENKLACLEAGVNKEFITDVLAIANTKVTDDKDLSKVLEEMKKDNHYSMFFGSDAGSAGTGTNPGHTKGNDGGSQDNLGARLAKANAQPKKTESNFF